MSARASVFYDTQYLRDVLYLEDVEISGTITSGNSSNIQITLDDQLVDDLVKSLTALQRDRDIAAARQRVRHLTKELACANHEMMNHREQALAIKHDLDEAERTLAALGGTE